MKHLLIFGLICTLAISTMAKKRYDDEEDQQVVFKKQNHKQSLFDEPTYAKLEEISDHPLGAKILQTIALQLKGSDSLGAVSKLLNDLRTDLEAKEIDADNEHAQVETQCKNDLESYAQRISLAVNEIKDSEFKAKRLAEAVEVYTTEIEIKVHQIEEFQEKDSTVRKTRVQDNLDYSARVAQMKEMLQAFEVILPKIHLVYDAAVAPGSVFVEEDAMNEALVQMSKIGSTNPITSLVALTSTLEPSSVQALIEKLEEIRDSIDESLNVENETEAQSQRDTDVILGEVFTAIENLTREKASDEEALQETIRNHDIQEKRARDAHAEFNAAKNGLEQRTTQCDEYELQYQDNFTERTKEINIIKDVQNIIATKLEVVSSFIQENNVF